MITVRCEQFGQEFQSQRRSAKFCSALCRQHHRRGHPPVVPPPTFWERFNRAFEEAKVLVASPDHIGDRWVELSSYCPIPAASTTHPPQLHTLTHRNTQIPATPTRNLLKCRFVLE